MTAVTDPFSNAPVDTETGPWTPHRVSDYWRLVARDRTLEVLRNPTGRDRAVFDAACDRIEDLVHRVSNGALVQYAHDGARQGFLDAACDFWRALARTEMAAVGPGGDGKPVRLRLEPEIRQWSRLEQPLARMLAEAVAEGFTEAYLAPTGRHLTAAPPIPTTQGGPRRRRRMRA